MTREEKQQVIEDLKVKFSQTDYFYLADASSLSVEKINALRRICFQQGVEFRVAKNTLIQKALEAIDKERYSPVFESLHGPTAVMFTEVSNLPAKILKDFRKTNERPLLKAAYIDTAVFVGDESMEDLSKLKSKNELLGEIIGLLQSPAKNVISALQGGGQKLAGIVKTLQERG